MDCPYHWIGRSFDLEPNEAGGVTKCKVTKWAPTGQGDDEEALWHVEHDDGDSEDMQQGELADHLRREEGAYTSCERSERSAQVCDPSDPQVHCGPSSTPPSTSFKQLVQVRWHF